MTAGFLAGGRVDAIDVVGTVVVGLAAAVGAVVVASVARAGLGNRRFVLSLAGAMGLAGVGSALTALVMARTGHDTVGTLDVAFFAAAVLLGAALVHHPDLGTPRQRARVLADAMIAGLSLAILLWLVAGRGMFERGDPPLLVLGLVLATAIGFAITRVGLVVTLHRAQGTTIESASAVLTGAFLACTLGGLARLLGEGPLASRGLVALGYLAVVGGIVLVIVAGRVLSGATRIRITPGDRRRFHSLLEVTPIVTAVAAVTAVLVDAALRGAFDVTAAGVLTVVISSVLLRQSMTLADNRELSGSLRATVDELEQQATHDALTGLPNRFGLDDRIAGAARRAGGRGTRCAVYFVDLDHLKTVNDTLGHGAGDQLIRATAARLRGCLGDRVTRFGGDEFVLVADDLDSVEDAERLGRSIMEVTGEPVMVEGHPVRSSASVGVAVADGHVTADELLRRADVALYRAKGLGRRCVVRYRPEDDAGTGDDLDLEPELRRALDHGEFTLHYQPIVDLCTGDVVAVESLLRWQHPTRGLLTPDRFLAQAISSGLLGAIGEASLRRACTDFATVDATGSPSVSVNLSSSELADHRVVRRVAAALADSGLAPGRLTLEITEDVIVDETVRAAIDELVALGVHLAIDDFGTGNSSLRQLGAYPADVLKIDKTFVDRVEDDERARAITAAIVRMARDLGLTTVAEGVETEAQADVLAEMGCDRAQGWLFAAAMPMDVFTEWCGSRPPGTGYGDSRSSVASASSMMRPSSSATGGRSSIAPTT